MLEELHRRARQVMQSGLLRPGAQRQIATPRQSEGAFYPHQRTGLPGSDLLGGAVIGPVLHLFGQVLDYTGEPITGARVEIWQPGPDGIHQPDLPDDAAVDGFSGYGVAETPIDGSYRFRTLVPTPSTERTAHIHARVTLPDGRVLTTQIYLLDEPANARDWIFQSLGPARQAAATIDPVICPDGALEAGFNIVI